ncbi:MAG: hypothetical protein K2Q20_08485 [Phycisphaerales bacterium]|nr:hypothetical protein [Phycisphaerales bacterium]
MARPIVHLLAAFGVAAIAPAVHAAIVNPSFEDVYPSPNDPIFTLPVGWNTSTGQAPGYDPWDTSWADSYDIYMSQYFAPSDGERMGINSSTGILWQSVTFSAGDTILVDVAMVTDASLASGAATVALGSFLNYAASASYSVPLGGGFGGLRTPWIGWHTVSLTVPATGTYDLILIGSFGGTADGKTHTYFDNIRVVPSPGAAAFLTLGGLLAARRRRNAPSQSMSPFMRRSAPRLVAVMGVAAIASASHAAIVNPSFEQVYQNPLYDGFLLPVGWEVGYNEGVWSESRDWLSADSPLLPTNGQWTVQASFSNTLSQQVSLNAGDQLQVDVAMYCDAFFADGRAAIRLGDYSNPAARAQSYVVMSSYNAPLIGWHTLSLTVPATGTYELGLDCTSGGTGDGSIHFYFDNVRVVPSPGAAALLGVGTMLAARRRRMTR